MWVIYSQVGNQRPNPSSPTWVAKPTAVSLVHYNSRHSRKHWLTRRHRVVEITCWRCRWLQVGSWNHQRN